ncbi:hypothetical protein [Flavobacterium sp.]|uniref:hypothetical protein n=1 Tax=Flavobacterium sp. TaxID=239 RepID=UPI0037534C6C
MDNEKKPLPYSATKSELVTMYVNQMSKKTIRKQINEILIEKGFSILSKRIEHNEFMEYVETYGLPKGYKLN